MVEERGLIWVAGVGEKDFFGFFVRCRMTCRVSFSLWQYLTLGGGFLTGCHLIEAIDQMALVLVPGDVETGSGEDFADAIFSE